jgi:hypothetical protein
MKTRNGFVSNSSTSSFIVIACEAPEEKLTKEVRERLMKRSLLLQNDGEEYLGKILWTAHDDIGYETKNFHAFRDEMESAYGLVHAEAAALGIKAPIEVIYGVAYEGGFAEAEE